MRLLCVANAIMDVTAEVASFPEQGGDTLARSGSLRAGGAGFNVMVAARRLRVTCLYGGTHGTGPFGDAVRAAMAGEGIEILHAAETEADTGWDIAITDDSAERTFITVVGAEAILTAERLASVTALPGDAVYVSGYGLQTEPQRTAVCEWLQRLPPDTMVVTDPGPLVADIPVAALEAVLARTNWWSANAREAEAMTGERDPIAAAQQLAAKGCGVIVRRGEHGCVVAEPGSPPRVIAGFQVEAIDSNGAGDTHVGAFIASILSGLNPDDSARRANAAAAYSVTMRGPATGPTEHELELFMAARAVK